MFGECHAHMFMNGIDFDAAVSEHADRPDEALVRAHLKAYADRGITFVREGGDNLGVSTVAKRIAPELGIDYRSPVFGIHRNGHYGRIVGFGYDDMAGYAALVRRAYDEGADFIKVMTTGIMDFNVFGRITGTALPSFEVSEMVHIAHEHGLAVMSHTNGKRAVLDALAAGVDSIEHGNFIDAECLDAFVDTGCVLVPTATVARSLIGRHHGDDEVLERIWNHSQEVIEQGFDKGVTFALGSDGGAIGVLHGEGLVSEYACFTDTLGPSDELDSRLAAGEARIREVFRRS